MSELLSLEETKYFLNVFLVSRKCATLSSATQHAIPPESSGRWRTECLDTRFPLFTLLCAGYTVNWWYTELTEKGDSIFENSIFFVTVSQLFVNWFFFYFKEHTFQVISLPLSQDVMIRYQWNQGKPCIISYNAIPYLLLVARWLLIWLILVSWWWWWLNTIFYLLFLQSLMSAPAALTLA